MDSDTLLDPGALSPPATALPNPITTHPATYPSTFGPHTTTPQRAGALPAHQPTFVPSQPDETSGTPAPPPAAFTKCCAPFPRSWPGTHRKPEFRTEFRNSGIPDAREPVTPNNITDPPADPGALSTFGQRTTTLLRDSALPAHQPTFVPSQLDETSGTPPPPLFAPTAAYPPPLRTPHPRTPYERYTTSIPLGLWLVRKLPLHRHCRASPLAHHYPPPDHYLRRWAGLRCRLRKPPPSSRICPLRPVDGAIPGHRPRPHWRGRHPRLPLARRSQP